MESATITKVTLRQEKLRSGKLSLYLDYYPPIWNPHIKKMSRREFLGLYLFGNPKDKFELDYNEEIMLKARGIRATRELAIINEEFGFLDRTKRQADFLEYFESKTKEKYQKWEIVYKHFKDFCNSRCLMKDVTIGLCNDFRTYILKIRVKQSGNIISRNSAAGYWSTFRALLKLAYKEGWLRENVNDYLDRIDWEDPKINYLEIEEVKRLAATPCKVDVLKRASLFACMTGLRISDILQLRWENIEVSPDGGYCMRIRTQKTKTQATLPLSDEALLYCGEPGLGMVFKGLSRAHTREPFKKWLKDAGIKKKITFHGLRHTYATLLITNGTDIYTVSKMLTHKNVATTQIYADVVNQKKRDAANSISLK